MAHIDQPDWMTAEHLTGTTIMAVEFADGVVFGADSRTTTGSYVANRVTDKLTRITDNIYCCRSGSAADTQAIADIVRSQLQLHCIESNSEPEVAHAASAFRGMCFKYRERLMAGIICAGYDKKKGGQVFSIPIGGLIVRQPFAIGGSGSTFLYGHCDATYKEGMTKAECLQFVRNALALAMARDGSSGGVARTAVITAEGIERETTLGNELPTFYEG